MNIRCVPAFTETLLSVDQLWEDAKVEVRFADHRKLFVPDRHGRKLKFPFSKANDGLFIWSVVSARHAPGAHQPHPGIALAATDSGYDVAEFHRARTTTHISSLGADEMAAHLHHRLHLSPQVIARLHHFASDIPSKVGHHRGSICPHCVEANATKLPHKSNDIYKPSYPGRLIHCDLVGPFLPSVIGGFQYALVLVDDHSRYKFVYFLRRKSEAIKAIRKFVASLKSHLNKGRSEPVHLVGSLHTDNAGEFLSHEFKDFLDEQSISQTTCPPHVHSLNGVAERAIRSIVENARSHITASGAPKSFWPYAFEHAVDILNRSTGPTGSHQSSFELLEQIKPKVLPIQPFGCRVVVVKPRHEYRKQQVEAHGSIGINLGRSPSVINGFRVWIPSQHRVVTTSEVYFDATFMPWRPNGQQRVGPITPLPAPSDDRASGIIDHHAPEPDEDHPCATDVSTAFDLATRGASKSARNSTKILVLCSSPHARPDGLNAFLKRFGMPTVRVDNCPRPGGGTDRNLLDDSFFHSLLDRVRAGEFCGIFASPPSSTFSVSRFYHKQNKGAPVIRTRSHILGVPDIDSRHRKELLEANAVVARTVKLLDAQRRAGGQFVVEHPSDRGDRACARSYLEAEHGSLWQMPDISNLAIDSGAESADFNMCMLGAPWQEQTTLLYTSGLSSWLNHLRGLDCSHSSHTSPAVGEFDLKSPKYNLNATATHPAEYNLFLAKAFASLHTAVQSPLPGHKPALAKEVTHDGKTGPTAPPSGNKVRPALPSFDRSPTGNNILADRFEAAALAPEVDINHPRPQLDANIPPLVPPTPRPPRVQGEERRVKEARAGHDIRDGLRSRRALLALSGALLSLSAWTGRANLVKAPITDPKNRKEALAQDSPGWTVSMDEEYKNHESNGSWEWIRRGDVPRGRHLIKLVWVYKVKRDGRLKSRLCVQGCAQTAGIDYDQTHSAALRSSSLRLLASLAAREQMGLHRWDFVSAYLQGELEEGEVVYCSAPPGYERTDDDGEQMCCKIVKPVYGMAQAGRRWQRCLFPWLLEVGMTASKHDPCLFHRERDYTDPSTGLTVLDRLVVGVYVDDLACGYKFSGPGSLYDDFVHALSSRWKVEDEGELSDLLGVDFIIADGTVTLAQTNYIRKMVSTYLNDAQLGPHDGVLPHTQELERNVTDALSQDDAIVDSELRRKYQSLVGALLYCTTNTRPDIAFAVGMLCRAMSKPTHVLYSDAVLVLQYLQRTEEIGLRFAASESPVHGYSDSDWATKHSTSGWVFMLNHAAISWGSKKQKSVALSSCEAEIVAASEAAKEAVHLSALCSELGLGLPDNTPMNLFMDNKSAIDVAYNPQHHGRMKHVDRRHFYVRELVEKHVLRVPFVSTVNNYADIFTKALKAPTFFRLRDQIMNVPERLRELSNSRVSNSGGAL